MADPFYYTRECMDYVHDLLDRYKSEIGVEYIAYGDTDLLPRYPNVVVTGGPRDKSLISTHKFQIIIRLDLWIHHANANVDKKTRTKEDLELAERVEAVLDGDATLGGNIIFGYVESETPGVLVRGKGNLVISTRLAWMGESRQSFA